MFLTALPRRRFLAGAGALGLTGLIGGCTDATSPATNQPTAPPQSTFPATVTHKYGTTEIPAAPDRIVSVGLTEQDTLLALGHVPVAVTEWYNEQPDATWPWAHDLLGDAHPEVLDGTDGLQFEQIAALAPDLIVGTNAGLTQEDYGKLSKIAPTVANTGEFASDYFEPWPAQTLLRGQALGREADAQGLIDDLKAQFAEAAAANPQFAGTMAIFLQAPYYEGNAIAYQKGLSTDFLTDLGFDIPAVLDQFSEDGAQAYIPVEKLDVLDAGDVLVWATEDEEAEKALAESKLFGQLRAVQEGRSIYTGNILAGALYFSTVLSLPYVLAELLPALQEAFPAE